jgi:hypothetical protein
VRETGGAPAERIASPCGHLPLWWTTATLGALTPHAVHRARVVAAGSLGARVSKTRIENVAPDVLDPFAASAFAEQAVTAELPAGIVKATVRGNNLWCCGCAARARCTACRCFRLASTSAAPWCTTSRTTPVRT